MVTLTDTIRRYVSAALTAVLFRRWSDAADFFSVCQQECLVMASQPRQDVPPPGSLAPALREIAERATDPQAKAHWVRIAKEETGL